MSDMEAGRELDALVAERVFDQGWMWEHEPESIPFYSTDISAAWEVVERLTDTVPFFGLDRDADGWCAEFDNGSSTYQGLAPTAPHAICLAALEAMEDA